MQDRQPFLIRVLRSRPLCLTWAAIDALVVGGGMAIVSGAAVGAMFAAVAFVVFAGLLEFVGRGVRDAELRRQTAAPARRP